jgi:SOS-response transcriptional repressor LexA
METSVGAAHALPLVGRVQAGFPSPATEALQDTITLHQYLVDHLATSESMPVPDDAMAGAGIFKGDLAIIEKRTARPGEIVLAEIDGELVLRKLMRDSEGCWLEAAHKDEPSIVKGSEMRILGILTGLARKM